MSSTSHSKAKADGANVADIGRATFLRAFGTEPDDFVSQVNSLAPALGQLILEMEFGDIYNRPGLDLATRELVIIAACAALGATGHGALRMHIPAALRNGASKASIVETLVQVGLAAGLPAALGALAVASETFGGLEPGAGARP